MRVFFSRSFDSRDSSITNGFKTILDDLDIEIEEGKGVDPEAVDEVIIQQISRCHAFLGVVSPEWKEPSAEAETAGQFPFPNTNVIQEIAVARTLGKDLYLFVEKGVRKFGFVDNNSLYWPFSRNELSGLILDITKELRKKLKLTVDPRSRRRNPIYVNRLDGTSSDIRITWNRNNIPDLAGGQVFLSREGVEGSSCLFVANTDGNWNWRSSQSIATLSTFGTSNGLYPGCEIYFYCRVKVEGQVSIQPLLSGGRNKEAKWINLCFFKETPLSDSGGKWIECFLVDRIWDGEDPPIREDGHPLHLISNTGQGALWIDEIEFGTLQDA